MNIAANDYYGNDAFNVKDGLCQKRSAVYVGGQTKNTSPENLQKKEIFQIQKKLSVFSRSH